MPRKNKEEIIENKVEDVVLEDIKEERKNIVISFKS